MEDAFFFFGWMILGPAFPSAIATGASYLAYRRAKAGLYRTLNISAFLVMMWTCWVAWSVMFGETSKDNQAGLVLIFLPLWNPLIFLACFGFVYLIYISGLKEAVDRIKNKYFEKVHLFALKISLASVAAYLALWICLWFKGSYAIG